MKKNIAIILAMGIVYGRLFALPEYGSQILLNNMSKYLMYIQVQNTDWEGPGYFFDELLPGKTAQFQLFIKRVPTTLTLAVKRKINDMFWKVRWQNDVSSQNDRNVLSITYQLNPYQPSFIEIDQGSQASLSPAQQSRGVRESTGKRRLDFIYHGYKPIELIIDENTHLVLPSEEAPK